MSEKSTPACAPPPRFRRGVAGWAVLAYLALLYGSAPWMGALLGALRAVLGAAFVPGITAAAVLALALPAGALLARGRIGRRGPRTRRDWGRAAGLAGTGIAFGVALALVPYPEERMHLVQYALLAGLITAWLSGTPLGRAAGRGGVLRLLGTALLLAMAAGAGDELFQAWLPDRVGDLRDVALNWIAALLTQTVLVLLPARDP